MVDSEHDIVPGARDVGDVLMSDPLFRVANRRLDNPVVLGVALFIIVVAMILLGPSTESRFIYTDF
ncbi:MAG: hypothetical protein M3169_01515 [Candidatus Eremiobacteraeota bacterium]|nr:hypothetical protein [Candidatus Eremiobacteraeota bacterium]